MNIVGTPLTASDARPSVLPGAGYLRAGYLRVGYLGAGYLATVTGVTSVLGVPALHAQHGLHCLSASGWVARTGLRLGLWHADADCGGGSWALTAGGVLLLALGLALIAAVVTHGTRSAALRLVAVLAVLLTARVPAGSRLRSCFVATVVRARRRPRSLTLRGPPAA